MIHVGGEVACTDCSIYADDLAKIWNDAGWDVITGIAMGSRISSVEGLALLVADASNLNELEGKVFNALKSAGVSFTITANAIQTPQLMVVPLLPR